ncbi:MAG: TadE/TadG family type IV pilus assembly protein [Terriglobales bacterium]
MTNPRSHLRLRGRGAAMAEFALITPLLLMLMIGTVQLGRALYAYHFLAVAARQAARYAMVRGADCTSFASACPAGASDIQSYVQSLSPGVIDASAITVSTTWAPNNAPGGTVTITVQYPFDLDVPLVPAAALTLQSSSQMVISQ